MKLISIIDAIEQWAHPELVKMWVILAMPSYSDDQGEMVLGEEDIADLRRSVLKLDEFLGSKQDGTQAKDDPLFYVQLTGGRFSPTSEVNDDDPPNLTDGPVFGPYKWIHLTYTSTIQMIKAGPDGPTHWLNYENDCVYYAGMYWSDMVIINMPAGTIGVYEEDKARLPAKIDKAAWEVQFEANKITFTGDKPLTDLGIVTDGIFGKGIKSTPLRGHTTPNRFLAVFNNDGNLHLQVLNSGRDAEVWLLDELEKEGVASDKEDLHERFLDAVRWAHWSDLYSIDIWKINADNSLTRVEVQE